MGLILSYTQLVIRHILGEILPTLTSSAQLLLVLEITKLQLSQVDGFKMNLKAFLI